MSKLSVCILFGGMSPEHEVSLRSAESVLNNIDHNKYNVFPVGIAKDGDWIIYGGKDYSELPAGTWMDHPDESSFAGMAFPVVSAGKPGAAHEWTEQASFQVFWYSPYGAQD